MEVLAVLSVVDVTPILVLIWPGCHSRSSHCLARKRLMLLGWSVPLDTDSILKFRFNLLIVSFDVSARELVHSLF